MGRGGDTNSGLSEVHVSVSSRKVRTFLLSRYLSSSLPHGHLSSGLRSSLPPFPTVARTVRVSKNAGNLP